MTKMLTKQFTLLCTCVLISFNLSAKWYQGQATVPVSTFNLEEGRTYAIKAAIANATLQSGSFISIEEITLDGLLTSSKTTLTSHTSIRRVEILSEQLLDETLKVTVNVDVAQVENCPEAKYKKSLLVSLMALSSPRQAAQGNIFNLGQHVTSKLAEQLATQAGIYVNGVVMSPVLSIDQLNTIKLSTLQSKGDYLQQSYGSQLVLLGYIRDIGLFSQQKKGLILDDSKNRRNFTLELVLYDTVYQQILLKQSYHGEADWPYDDSYSADLTNSLFWRNNFGRMIINTLSHAVTDVQDKVSCLPMFARVLQQSPRGLYIDAKQVQGINQYDRFELVKRHEILDYQSNTQVMLMPEKTQTFKASQVNPVLAELVPSEETQLTSVVGDYVIPIFHH